MALAGLKARNGRGYKYFPSPNAYHHVSDNRLGRQFAADRPDEKWVSDITYIKLNNGYAYLAVVMDLYSRRVIGWALERTMTTELVLEALEMAIGRRSAKPGLLLHSDRGVQYRAVDYQYRMEQEGIEPSMSRKGNCWHNAAMESFFARLKVESIYCETFRHLDDAYRTIFEYIELFYNSVRRHSTLGYISPNQYEENYHNQIK